MRYSLFTLMFFMLFAACKKADSPGLADHKILPGSYTANGMTYNIYSHCLSGCKPNCSVSSIADYGYDEPARYLYIMFSENPINGKSYRVSHNPYTNEYPPSKGEIYIEVGQAGIPRTIYASNGNEGVFGTVSLQNGKRVINIPEFSAHNCYVDNVPDIKVSVQGIMVE